MSGQSLSSAEHLALMSMENSQFRISPAEVHRSVDFDGLAFKRSDELLKESERIGQDRAADAIEYGIKTPNDGYNVYVMGPAGSHRHALAQDMVSAAALTKPIPDDWCYVNNFVEPERPRALQFPAGRGAEFRADMRTLIDEMRIAIPAAFESDDYRNQLKAYEVDAQESVRNLWRSLDELAAKEDIGVMQTPTGYVLAPVRDGEVLGDKEFDQLPDAEKERIKDAIARLSKELEKRIEQLPQMSKQYHERIKELNREFTARAVGLLLKSLEDKYSDLPEVVEYLSEVKQNIIEHAEQFREKEPSPMRFLSRDSASLFSQYEVNLVVNNAGADAAPVIYEPNPSYPNIIGNIEHRAELGALVTDFSMVRCGALARANGGYLILDVERVLQRPFVWEGIKQAMLEKRVRIESPAEMYGVGSTTTLRPEEIPLDIKLVLVGKRWLYYLLSRFDSEFTELFRVAADIDDDMDRSEANVNEYALLMAQRIREHALRPFSRAALQRVADESSRLVDDSERLSTHIRSLDDVLIQSNYCATQRGVEVVDPQDVVAALEERVNRLNRVQLRIIDAIERNTLLIDTAGARVGQVNGLSVVTLGEFRFGYPTRITATTRIGTGSVVDIEREVELGGAIHSKGVMILSSALAARYVRDVPLSMHGSIVFEQSYGGVDGDSASVAELTALLSSLANIPVRQNIAVTGSVNQLGEVQAIGGVNEKIEGYFAVCKTRGLDGSHGVVIPRDNVKNLMLKEDVVDAIGNQQFHVFAVSTIDEAVEILTGEKAGERGDQDEFPEDTVNYAVEKQLIEYAQKRRNFGLKEEKVSDES